MRKTSKHLSEDSQSISQESNKKHYSLPSGNQGILKGLPGFMSFEGLLTHNRPQNAEPVKDENV
jgi:hypothetical protein